MLFSVTIPPGEAIVLTSNKTDVCLFLYFVSMASYSMYSLGPLAHYYVCGIYPSVHH